LKNKTIIDVEKYLFVNE